MRNLVVLLLAFLVPAAGPLRAQGRLTLAEALARAERGAYTNRVAAGESEARSGEALAPLEGILPTARFEGGYVRTTDPLGAFGFTLRQRAVTPASFAPAALNDPPATGNLMTGLVVELPLFNADAWVGRQAAKEAREAARSAERWTRAVTAVEVARGYWGVVLATERVRTLEASLAAARSHQREAESLAQRGMVTRSDALLASVKAGEVEAALIGARSEARVAKLGLAMLMGEAGDTGFTLPDSLPSAERVSEVADREASDFSDASDSSAAARADVVAAQHASAAMAADHRRARALYLPRLNSFGRLEWNTSETPFGGKNAWTLGVMLSWSPFSGARELSEARIAGGRELAAGVQTEAAVAHAALELERATAELAVARSRLEIARLAETQAREAHRIVSRKYDGGLATVTELFDAAAVETDSRLRDVVARHDVLIALAEKRKAQGLDLSPLQNLES
jgi:outer membrane protein TolC